MVTGVEGGCCPRTGKSRARGALDSMLLKTSIEKSLEISMNADKSVVESWVNLLLFQGLE